ncbi:MAG: DUF5011 domain-containing protein [Blautia sp.]|nr:DUF5011 domain-containing protein [Blautia sp.]
MKKRKPVIIGILKFLIVAAALANLAALFFFDYKIPDFGKSLKTSSVREEEKIPQDPSSDGYAIQVDSDSLTYDGTGTLDLLKGVSLTGPEGIVSDAEIFAHIKTGDSLKKKVIEYTADTEQGQVTASRSLILSRYSGPSIQLPDTLPQIGDDQLDSIMDVMPSDGSFHADDGYGNDITSSVKASYTADSSDSSVVHVIFTVTNSYNDTVSEAADLHMIHTKPFVILNESAVTVPLNSGFDPMSYVVFAEDVDGTSLISNLQVQGTVNTAAAGDYALTYQVTSSNGTVSDPKILKVTVQ